MPPHDVTAGCVQIPVYKVETKGIKEDIARLEKNDEKHYESYDLLSRRISTPVAYVLTVMGTAIGFLTSQLITLILEKG